MLDPTQRSYFKNANPTHYHFQTRTPYFAKQEASLLAPLYSGAPGGRMLEVGCGEGGNLAHVLAHDPSVDLVGVDASVDKIHFARGAVPLAKTLVSEAGALPFAEGSFQRVLIRDLLHHLPDRLGALREAHRVLAKGGQILLIEPSRRSPLVWLQAALFAEERGALRVSQDTIAEELRQVGFVRVHLVHKQPLPLSRVLLHPQSPLFGLALAGRIPGVEAIFRKEALFALLMPRSFWLYLCYTARKLD